MTGGVRDGVGVTGSAEPPQKRLQGQLGVRDLVFTVLAYNAPLAVMSGYVPLVVGVGNGTGAPMTFIAVGLLLLVFSVGLTTMSRFMKSPGAFYSYITAGIGRPLGLGSAFTAFTGYTVIAAATCAYAGIVTNAMITSLFDGPALPWWIWGLCIWCVATGMSLLRINLSAKVLGVVLLTEIVLVAAWNLTVFVDGGPDGVSFESFSPTAFTSGSISFALLFGVLCLTGFEAVAVFRDETRDPIRTVPRATYAAVALLAGMYAIGAWAYLTAFGAAEAQVLGSTDPSGSFLASVKLYTGTVASDLVAVLLISSTFAAVLATQNISARYLYTLGRDGVLPRALGRVHDKHGSPHIAASTVALMVLLEFGVPALLQIDPLAIYSSLAGFGGFCLLFLMTVTSAAVVVFFRRHSKSAVNIWQSVVAPVVSFTGLAIILALAATNMESVIGGSVTGGRIALLIAACVIGAGIATALYYRSKNRAIFNQIGHQDI